ncbi:MAG: hypothetical protein WC615_00350 [Mucilaginibacter sp.]|jgi:hypothetical protein|uniref:hypothetical protein n=1 Tax=Mucilaginibacter sp. TaxID=1882438 RepID=UPI0035657CC1
MKPLKFIILISYLLLAVACNNRGENSIAGVYVMSFKNDYSTATDTIIIEAYNIETKTFLVERRDGFHRIREGKILPKEYKQQHWIATFNEEKQALQETEIGKQIYINQAAGTLSFGATYRKIK